MSLDLENLPPSPDIENFDASKLDRGDSIPQDDPKPVDEPVDEPVDDPKDEDEPEEPKDEPKEADEEEPEEKPRDEKGRFEKKDAKIPKARFDEAVGKEREQREAAERRAAELERRLQATQQAQVQTEQIEKLEESISGLEKKHAELLLDGDVESAAKIMKEIRMAERQIARAEADERANQRTTQLLEADRMDVAIARLEADYPQFNPESEDFDEDLVELVLAKQRTLIQKEGMSPSQAISKAAKQVAERFVKEVEEKPDEKGLAASKAQKDRKAEQVKKNIDTAKKQPASMKDSGIDSDKVGNTGNLDVTKMTQDEFKALPASTLAKLRGDFV